MEDDKEDLFSVSKVCVYESYVIAIDQLIAENIVYKPYAHSLALWQLI